MFHNRSTRWFVALIVLVAAVFATGLTVRAGDASSPASSMSPNMTAFATGLNNPRGLKFGPDGYLYVAEGGTGGTQLNRGESIGDLFHLGN